MKSHPALLPWVVDTLADSKIVSLSPVAGDASARRYYRLSSAGQTYIAVEAPPASEKNAEFLAVQATLAAAGVKVPELIAVDLTRGFLLLEDLGERLLLDELTADNADRLYGEAFDVLQQIAAAGSPAAGWPGYDPALLAEELGRFPQWFVGRLLSLGDMDTAIWQPVVRLLTDNAIAQPQVLVHRDFHSRNLMLQADGTLGVIDFQDAVLGPVTYDLVSLLRDCYVRWEPDEVRAWALAYRQRDAVPGAVSDANFLRWFDLMGLQRHLKVLGTFARLHLRDGKPGYLDDLPLVVQYVRECLAQYHDAFDEIAAFSAWFESSVMPAARCQPWGRSL